MDTLNLFAAMKFILVCLFAIGAIVYVYGRPEDRYTNRFDNIDVDQILQNDRLLKRYVDCLLDKPNVRCPPEAAELKSKYAYIIHDRESQLYKRQRD